MSKSCVVSRKKEVILAVRALQCIKAAGPDGHNKHFCIDTKALMVLAMIALGNELLHSGEPPQSFPDVLVLSTEKGDS